MSRFDSHGGGWGYSGHSIEAVRYAIQYTVPYYNYNYILNIFASRIRLRKNMQIQVFGSKGEIYKPITVKNTLLLNENLNC